MFVIADEGKKFVAQEPPTHLSSETPSPAPDPPTAPTQASAGPATGAEALQQPHAQPAGLAVPSQPVALVPERRPQLWPSSGGPLAAAPLPSGVLLKARATPNQQQTCLVHSTTKNMAALLMHHAVKKVLV